MRNAALRLVNTKSSERTVFNILLHLFKTICPQSNGTKTFVDSGANEGIYSLVAAAYGCKVIAIEPQRECVRLMQAAFKQTGLAATIVQRILSPFPTGAYVPIDQCHGTAQYLLSDQKMSNSILPGRKQLGRKPHGLEWINSTRLDAIVDVVNIWHLDGEGSEVEMIKSTNMSRVQHATIEVIPFRWSSTGIKTSIHKVSAIFDSWNCRVQCKSSWIMYNWKKHNMCKESEDVYCVNSKFYE